MKFNLSNLNKRVWMIIHDYLATLLALSLSLILRFDGAELYRVFDYLWFFIPLFAACAVAIYGFFSLYASKWRFASLPDFFNISKSVIVLSIILVGVDYFLISSGIIASVIIGKKVILIYVLFQMAALGIPRIIYRFYKSKNTRRDDEVQNIIVLGDANDVDVIGRAIEMKTIRGQILGFVTNHERDQWTKVRGIKSLGKPSDIENIFNDFKVRGISVKEVIITQNFTPPSQDLEQILGYLRRNNIGLKSYKLDDHEDENAGALVNPVRRLRDEELLLRSIVRINQEPLEKLIKGKRVMVTGGGGSIGQEITIQVAQLKPHELIIIENSEPALYTILERLELAGLIANVRGYICDIRDLDRVNAVFKETKPQLVYHAAALKHVPYLEEAPIEAFKTNALGTKNLADSAKENGVEAFVLISTDKATRPTSILGATKRLAELYIQMMDGAARKDRNKQRFLAVRFGNVLGTSGSVVPRFAKQIAEGGPVTVTHKDMVRYFMTVKEATSLVLTSSSHALQDKGKSAAIYILSMGQPIRIYELAERMIKMAGFEPNKDIHILETGIRPGEKLNEELFQADEPIVDIGINGIVAAEKGALAPAFLDRIFEEFSKLMLTQDQSKMRQRLEAIVPNFRPMRVAEQIKVERIKITSTKEEKRLTSL